MFSAHPEKSMKNANPPENTSEKQFFTCCVLLRFGVLSGESWYTPWYTNGDRVFLYKHVKGAETFTRISGVL